MEPIIDTADLTLPHLDALKRAGVGTIIRYYNRSSRVFPNKRLRWPEARAIDDAGLAMAVVWQQNGRRLADFSEDRGRDDATRALACADAVGQPAGSAIYFAVDHDFWRPAELDRIAAHFAAVAAVLETDGRFAPGVYGSGAVAGRLEGLVRFVWLPRALGWSGSRAFHAARRWNLFQNQVDIRFGSLPIDTNLPNPDGRGFGAFTLAGPVAAGGPTALPARRLAVTARRGLNLRGGPGTGFGVVSVLEPGAQVWASAPAAGDWQAVDLEGDGQTDGFCHRGFLAPVV